MTPDEANDRDGRAVVTRAAAGELTTSLGDEEAAALP